MQSNLTLPVNFADTIKPTIAINSPTANQKMTTALANVKGTASDNWGVGSVQYQLNSGAWGRATSTSRWTNWMVVLPLIAGTNLIKADAMDLGETPRRDRGVEQHLQPGPWLEFSATKGKQRLSIEP